MKKLNINKAFFVVISIIFLVGLLFAYLIADIEDAPGFILLGFSVTTLACMMSYVLVCILDELRKNNELLNNIYNELKIKNTKD